jgi:nuclear pore complex protein Nup107
MYPSNLTLKEQEKLIHQHSHLLVNPSQNTLTPPTSTLAQAIMNASPLLTELIVVCEWLQETAPAPLRPEATTGYWKFTKYSVMQSLRTCTGLRDGLVKVMR